MFGVEPHYGKLRSEVKIVEKEKEKEMKRDHFHRSKILPWLGAIPNAD